MNKKEARDLELVLKTMVEHGLLTQKVIDEVLTNVQASRRKTIAKWQFDKLSKQIANVEANINQMLRLAETVKLLGTVTRNIAQESATKLASLKLAVLGAVNMLDEAPEDPVRIKGSGSKDNYYEDYGYVQNGQIVLNHMHQLAKASAEREDDANISN